MPSVLSNVMWHHLWAQLNESLLHQQHRNQNQASGRCEDEEEEEEKEKESNGGNTKTKRKNCCKRRTWNCFQKYAKTTSRPNWSGTHTSNLSRTQMSCRTGAWWGTVHMPDDVTATRSIQQVIRRDCKFLKFWFFKSLFSSSQARNICSIWPKKILLELNWVSK